MLPQEQRRFLRHKETRSRLLTTEGEIMETSFLTTKARLIELQQVMRELPTVRFKHNPQKFNDNRWQVTLTLDSATDIDAFNKLSSRWYEEDASKEEKQGFWQKLFKFLKKELTLMA